MFIFQVAQKCPFNINNKGISRSSLIKIYFRSLTWSDSDKTKDEAPYLGMEPWCIA